MSTEDTVDRIRECIKERGFSAAMLIMDELSTIFLREALRHSKESPEYLKWKQLSSKCEVFEKCNLT